MDQEHKIQSQINQQRQKMGECISRILSSFFIDKEPVTPRKIYIVLRTRLHKREKGLGYVLYSQSRPVDPVSKREKVELKR